MTPTNKTSHPLLDIPMEQTVCFTGHRPDKLPQQKPFDLLLEIMRHHIELEIQHGAKYFLTGLADGVDYLAARLVHSLKHLYPHIVLIGVQPCPDYVSRFPATGGDPKHLQEMLAILDELVVLPEPFDGRYTYYRRNYFMVDNASRLIGVLGTTRSGSGQTLNYARRMGRRCVHIRLGPSVLRELIELQDYRDWPVTITGGDTY